MKRHSKVRHEFVEFIPKEREEGVVYVSIPYATAVHSCLCGCGTKVVTPISPVGWTLSFNGETISLSPSIGNWSFACRSHYFIRKNDVDWAGDMSDDDIASGRMRDRAARERHFASQPKAAATTQVQPAKRRSFWSWLTGRGE